MDKFFTQKFCDRCGGSLQGGRTMSTFNTECICLKCAREEKADPNYARARDAEHESVKRGDYNFLGIGR